MPDKENIDVCVAAYKITVRWAECKMKVSDYIVDFLIQKKIQDVFGYPGGMVTHFMDSLEKRRKEIRAHINYHEQGAAFAACGYAQASGNMGVAYATSGPGATNLITGICNAYFDSIPVMFITGQVNTYESKENTGVRQRGFQETDIVSMVKGVTKLAVRLDKADEVVYNLEKAWHTAMEGRRGPVLLDIPMNIQRADIVLKEQRHFIPDNDTGVMTEAGISRLMALLKDSKRPCIVAGAGVKEENTLWLFREMLKEYAIPVVTSMPAVGILEKEHELNYGFVGAYGGRCANFVVAKSDLVIAIGTRLDIRQTGAVKENFAPDAKLVRIDIDKEELKVPVKKDEVIIQAAASMVLEKLQKNQERLEWKEWLEVCGRIRKELADVDVQKVNCIVGRISEKLGEDVSVTTDVGQNQIWVAQSFKNKCGQKMLFSAGHGAMGYSLPAAIGAYYATGKPVICFNGDGGIQMNIQELQFVVRENLPVKIFCFNNKALGMIRHFQEMYFDSSYVQTTESSGYTVPSFERLAAAYGIPYMLLSEEKELTEDMFGLSGPQFIEILLDEKTYVQPKLEYGKPNQDQEPLLNRALYEKIMSW